MPQLSGWYVAEPIQFREVKDGEVTPFAMTLDSVHAQSLMDELYRAGIRPTGKPDLTDGEREAMKDHIVTLKDENKFKQGVLLAAVTEGAQK